MMRQTFPLPRNPMAPLFQRAAESLTTSLTIHSAHYYQCTGRHFLNFLDAEHPGVRSLGQLRRDPHILDWFTLLRSRQPALAKLTYSHYVIRLRRILEELAWTQGIPLLTRLVRADDIPRPDGVSASSSHSRTGPVDPRRATATRRLDQQRFAAVAAHRHAHRRVPRSAARLFALYRPGSVGRSCAPRQVADGAARSRRRLRPWDRPPSSTAPLSGCARR